MIGTTAMTELVGAPRERAVARRARVHRFLPWRRDQEPGFGAARHPAGRLTPEPAVRWSGAHRRLAGDESWSAGSLSAHVRAAVDAFPHDDVRLAAALAALATRESESIGRITTQMTAVLVELWDEGWLPEDVARTVGSRLSARHYAALAPSFEAAVDGALAAGGPVDPRWTASCVRARALLDGVVGGVPHLVHYVETLALVCHLRPLPEVCRPPGLPGDAVEISPAAAAAAADVAQRLQHARELLREAETVPSLQAAEERTEAAQRWLIEGSIERALERSATGRTEEPEARRVWLTLPDLDVKAALLAEVAAANCCRAVRLVGFDAVMVHGLGPELDAVELLFGSVLRQALAATTRYDELPPINRRLRARAARDGLFQAVAIRSVRRLSTAAADAIRTTTEHPATDRLGTVLAELDRAVERAAREVFRPVSARSAPWPVGAVNG